MISLLTLAITLNTITANYSNNGGSSSASGSSDGIRSIGSSSTSSSDATRIKSTISNSFI